MATTCLTNNFRKDILNAVINMSSDTIKMALYAGQSHNQNTTAYTTTGEASGTNYTAKGNTLSGATQATDTSNHVSHYDFNDTSWSSATITADSCLIYSDTVTSPTADVSIYVGDFGGSKSSSSGTFSVVFPAAAYNTSIIRIA
tara:strand:+ start:525 stop:956 length:432 start_codon:yes stop_codon:yes gene_type:complete